METSNGFPKWTAATSSIGTSKGVVRKQKPSQKEAWLPTISSVKKLPFVKAFQPLVGELPASFFELILTEYLTKLAMISLKDTKTISREAIATASEASENATKAVSKQYRKTALKIHPDKFGDLYLARFDALQKAYDVLRPEDDRHNYLAALFNIFEWLEKKKEKTGDALSKGAEKKFILDAHNEWVKENRDASQSEAAANQQQRERPLALEGGIGTRTPKQALVRGLYPSQKKAWIALPIPQPEHEFFTYCKEIFVALIDGMEEKVLVNLKGEKLKASKNAGGMEVHISLPDNSVWHIVWYAVLDFNGEKKETPRSEERSIDLMLQRHKECIERLPAVRFVARQHVGIIRKQLEKLSTNEINLARLDNEELERRYWKLHHSIVKAVQTRKRLSQGLRLLGQEETSCADFDLVALTEAINGSFLPKKELEAAKEGHRMKNELKAFKSTVADLLESGDAASWIESVSAEKLASIGGECNRLYQLLVDSKKAKSLALDPDTLIAASGRCDFFTPKQCEKLVSLSVEAEAQFAADATRAQAEEELKEKEAKRRKEMEKRATLLPYGATVVVIGLKNDPALNGSLGTYAGVADRDRFRVRLFKGNREVSLNEANFCEYNTYLKSQHNLQQTQESAATGLTVPGESSTSEPNGKSESQHRHRSPEKIQRRAHPPAIRRPTGSGSATSSTVCSSLLIPCSRMGKLIGKNGTGLRKLKEETGISDIDWEDADKAVGGKQKVVLSGTTPAVQKAETYCERELGAKQVVTSKETIPILAGTNASSTYKIGMVDKESSTSNALQAMKLNKPSEISPSSPKKTTDVVVRKDAHVPKKLKGGLIGPRGANLNRITKESGVKHITIDEPINGVCTVQVRGLKPCVDKALLMIEEFCAKKSGKMCTTAGAPGGKPLSPLQQVSRGSGCHSEATSISEISVPDVSSCSVTPPLEVAINVEDGLLGFICAQSACLKSSVSAEQFHCWLNTEDVTTIGDLAEAVNDADFLVEMQSHGLKGFKKTHFQKAVVTEKARLETNVASASPQAKKLKEAPVGLGGSVDGFSKHSSDTVQLECPISHVLMVNDPVVAADQHTYERAAIEEWFARNRAETGFVRSPMTNDILADLTLTPVHVIRTMAREYAEHSGQRGG